MSGIGSASSSFGGVLGETLGLVAWIFAAICSLQPFIVLVLVGVEAFALDFAGLAILGIGVLLASSGGPTKASGIGIDPALPDMPLKK